MNEERWVNALIDRIKELGKQIACIVIDSVFLSLWVVIQYFMNLLIQKLKPSGIDKVTLVVFQVIFVVSTLAPVILFIYKDLRIMAIKVQRQIRQETQIDENDRKDDA